MADSYMSVKKQLIQEIKELDDEFDSGKKSGKAFAILMKHMLKDASNKLDDHAMQYIETAPGLFEGESK